MINRTDLDTRIDAHRDQSNAVNQQQWQFETSPEPATSLRRGVAAKLAMLISKCDSRRQTQQTAIDQVPSV